MRGEAAPTRGREAYTRRTAPPTHTQCNTQRHATRRPPRTRPQTDTQTQSTAAHATAHGPPLRTAHTLHSAPINQCGIHYQILPPKRHSRQPHPTCDHIHRSSTRPTAQPSSRERALPAQESEGGMLVACCSLYRGPFTQPPARAVCRIAAHSLFNGVTRLSTARDRCAALRPMPGLALSRFDPCSSFTASCKMRDATGTSSPAPPATHKLDTRTHSCGGSVSHPGPMGAPSVSERDREGRRAEGRKEAPLGAALLSAQNRLPSRLGLPDYTASPGVHVLKQAQVESFKPGAYWQVCSG
jgi:hypothetical protein